MIVFFVDNNAKQKRLRQKSSSNKFEQSLFFQFFSSFLYKSGVSNKYLARLGMRASQSGTSNGMSSSKNQSMSGQHSSAVVVPVDTDIV